MKQKFDELMARFCAAAKLPGMEAIANGAPFTCGDILFAINRDSKRTQDLIFIHADFGPASEELARPVYYTLLEENFISAMDPSGTFGLSPVTGNVVYITQMPLAGATIKTLWQTIVSLSERAQHWRRTQFLDDPALSSVS